MKSPLSKFLLGVLTVCSLASISFGQSVVVNMNEPDTTDALAFEFGEAGEVDSSIFDEDRATNHARGQILTVAPGATQIASVTIRRSNVGATGAGSDQTFDVGDTMRLQIFEGDNTGFAFGFGHTTEAHGDDFFVDTADLTFSGPIVPFHDETFAIEGVFPAESYVTLNLAVPVQVEGRTQLGFLLTFEDSNLDGEDLEDGRFRYMENTAGNRCAVTTTAHAAGSSRSFQYALLPTIVEQEPVSYTHLTLPTKRIV